MTEIPVERDQCSRLRNARFKEAFVGATAELLIVNGADVVSKATQKIGARPADIFIKLNSHSAGSTGTGIIRSRAASAP